MINRRGLLLGALAMPAVVTAANIMPVHSIARLLLPPQYFLRTESETYGEQWFPLVEVGDEFLWKNNLGVGIVATHIRRPDGLIAPNWSASRGMWIRSPGALACASAA